MEQKQFDELAGRCEGLARAFLLLTMELEDAAVIARPSLIARLRQGAPRADSGMLRTAGNTLRELAAALEGARKSRQ